MMTWIILGFIFGVLAQPAYYIFLLWRDSRRYDKWRAAGGKHEDETAAIEEALKIIPRDK